MSRVAAVAMALVLGLGVGCAPTSGGSDARERQRWDETGRRCRGDVLLVDGGARPSAAATDGAVVDAAPVSAEAVERARAFTVAIHVSVTSHREGDRDDRGTAAAVSAPERRMGSGFVIDRAGLIVTNEHVVRNATAIEVATASDTRLSARIVASDPQSDLAVLAVEASMLSACELGQTDTLRPGEPLAALGFQPEGETGAAAEVRHGRCRRRRRSMQGALDATQRAFYGSLVESTVPVPRGFSGGPTIDANGRVVGVTTAATLDTASGRRIGFAIPLTPHVRDVIAHLARREPVGHGYVGLLVVATDDRTGPDPHGVRVEEAVSGAPAERAGVRVGDRILTVNDTLCTSAAHLAELVRAAPLDRPIVLGVDRGGEWMRVSVMPAARPARSTAATSLIRS